jgi:hypothetical protein
MRLTPLLALALAAFPGCKDKAKKDQSTSQRKVQPAPVKQERGQAPALESTPPADPRSPEKALRENRDRKRKMVNIDSNGDGTIDATERAEARDRRAKATFSRLDSDGDGALSREEISSNPRAQRLLLDFPRADANGDGSLSELEVNKALQSRAPRRGQPWLRR